ncbi:MarR family winged helix-turn-helix transcriptional regulator [Rhodoblastus sp.]|uniref:MarR family winged helix-turn-helix transcriptional regulator n=1 Tax=Rhodoblastus sp. TaxID=1962975 RepID=UPI003F9AAF5E
MSNQGERLPTETTHRIRDACLCLHTQRAARALARHFDQVLRPVDLTNGQFSLLNALNRRTPPSIAPVANLLAMDRTTLTAALKPLVRRGLVIVEADPDDRRSRLLRLTNEGHRRLAQAAPLWDHAHAAIEARLGQQAEPLRKALGDLA